MDRRRLEDDLAALARTEAALPPDLRARLLADARAAPRPRLGARAWGGVAGAALVGLAVGALAPSVVLDLAPFGGGAEDAFAGWLETAALEEAE